MTITQSDKFYYTGRTYFNALTKGGKKNQSGKIQFRLNTVIQ